MQDVLEDVIESIEVVESDSFRYDITVEDNHNFFADGILVHNCQNIPQRQLEKHKDDDFEVTVKLDGSSMTVYRYDGKIGLCSRNLELDYENDPNTTFAQVLINSGLKRVLENEEYEGIAIQGELMGPGIQGNQENLKEHEFFVFDVFLINVGDYLDSDLRMDLVRKLQGEGTKISHCPYLGRDTKAAQLSVDELLEMADGPSLNAKLREGLVFKSVQNPGFSFKAISNKWLLKNEG